MSVLLAVASTLAVSSCRQQQTQTAPQAPVVPVSVAKASRESVPRELGVVGTAEASAVVQIKSQIAGQLLRVHFSEGQSVEKGALLFEIDSRPYQEALRQAEAAVSRDRALIRQAEAALARDLAQAKTADADAERYGELNKAGIISRTQFDQIRTSAEVYRESARASQATIESARAALESNLAAVEKARLDIGYCKIQAPISGRTGNLLVHAGNLVKANDAPLVIIHQVSPVFVNFSVAEQHLADVRRLSANRKLSVRAFSREDAGRIAQGHLAVIDNAVDSATGTIRLKAEFANQDRLLWPGQFLNVVMTLDTIQNATVIPAEAIQPGQQGPFVYVVKADDTVEMRPVSPGRIFDRKAVIEKGVQPGEVVVIDGQLRLFPGVKIRAVAAGELQAGKS